jgi:phospholipase C
MANPIQYGDTVGLTHPGTSGRISPKDSKEFAVFTFTGGVGLIQNDNVVTLAPQVADQYSLLDSKQQWKLKINQPALHTGAHIILEAVPAGSRENQEYVVHKLRQDPIEHVVVLMLENRSFFRVFGYMDPERDNYVNYSHEGKAYYASPTDDRETPDPPHEIESVNISVEGGKPHGYVKAYQLHHEHLGTAGITEADYRDVMGYTRKGFLPTLHKMADFGRVCSQWYCSMSGPTWPNRMFAISGTSFNWRTTPEMSISSLPSLGDFLKDWYLFEPPAPQRGSIFEILQEKNTSYRVYSDNVGEFSLSWLFYPSTVDADDMDAFKEDAKKGTLPRFSFIEPNYIANSILGWIQNDDHPPADPLDAQKFVADVYESLRTGPKWNNTLLIVTYDEHGGFFDPIIPPPAPVPDAVSQDAEGTFAKFGVRVPTLLVSPCVAQGIDNTVYDHTSVLKYVLEKWAPESVGHLGERVKAANSLPVLAAPRPDPFPPINETDISKGRFLRLHLAWPGSAPAQAPEPKKLPLAEAAALALQDQDVLNQLKARLVENSLMKKDPAELAAIAVTGLSLGGLARVGKVTLDTAISSAASVAEAEKYAENILSQSKTSVSQLIGKVSGFFDQKSGEAVTQVQDVVASQIRATCLFASKGCRDNKLAQAILWAIDQSADELARKLIRKGKKL